MIEETARIVRVDHEFAFVETQQRAPCGSCQSTGSCSTTVLAGLFKRRPNELKVLNAIDAKPGEQVVIGIQEGALVKISLLVYLIPLVGILAGAIIVQQTVGYLKLSMGELPQVVGGLLGLIGGLMLLQRFALKRDHDPGFQAVILRRANQTPVQIV
jgi:sigma-E factor negative regulatory protein RseC